MDRPTLMGSMSWIVSASLNRNTSTAATMSIMATYLHHQQHKMHVFSLAVGSSSRDAPLSTLSICLPAYWLLRWLVCPHKLLSRVSLRLGPFCVCRKYYPPPDRPHSSRRRIRSRVNAADGSVKRSVYHIHRCRWTGIPKKKKNVAS